MCIFEIISLLRSDSEGRKWNAHRIIISYFHKIYINSKILFTDLIG